MNMVRKYVSGIFATIIITFTLISCSDSRIIIIKPPGNIAMMMDFSRGDDFSFYALPEFTPANWEEVSSGSLYICSMDDILNRPPLLPTGIVNMLNGDNLPPGTVISLEWSAQNETPDSRSLGFKEIYASTGLSYEECIANAFSEIRETGLPSVLLTDTNGSFEGKEDLMMISFK